MLVDIANDGPVTVEIESPIPSQPNDVQAK